MRVSGDPTAAIMKRRRDFLNRRGLAARPVVAAGLSHGSKVAVVRHAEEIIPGCDGLITDNPGLILSITVADCLPLYFYDPVKKVIAISHAGWRGVLADIASETIRALKTNFQSAPADIQAFIGPHLRSCHFGVQDDVSKMFSGYRDFMDSREGRYFIDLAAIVKNQLTGQGLSEPNIGISQDCSYCLSDRYFSHRRDRTADIEAMLAYIGIR
jgi:hypothetical protein